MRIADGSMLTVAELTAGFSIPEAPDTATAHCFRRHPRPSQGVLTGRPTTGLLLVWISPRLPELAQGLRDWGDFVHIRHIADAGIPGFTQISVYENVAPVDPMFMHFYEFDAEDPEATFSTMTDYVAPRLGGADGEAYASVGGLASRRRPAVLLQHLSVARRGVLTWTRSFATSTIPMCAGSR